MIKNCLSIGSSFIDRVQNQIVIINLHSISNVDSLDWKDYGVDAIVKKVCTHKNLANGSIILMHNGATYTEEALESVIEGLQEKGYTIVSISELLIKDNYHIDFTGRQIAD